MTRASEKSKPSRTLSPDALRFVAERFRVLGEPMRLKLLMALETGEKNVTELVQLTDSTQANVSKHLGILSDAAMVSRRKEGLKTFYVISEPQIFELCDLMCSKLQKEFTEKSRHFR
ncbi:MAG TPA: metalloregulator ArsR/SmtB family transcription factor [Chthoniobacterales bacterium]|nr:metalloregulator ArsR/SmtB family transcription factor [Chthoniobacterales bacterium]